LALQPRRITITRQIAESDADFNRRGLLQSGMAVTRRENIGAQVFESWVKRALNEVLEQF